MTAPTTTQRPPSESQTSSPGWAVPTRRVSFSPRLEDLPKHFAKDGNIIASHFAAGASTIFPDSEQYFVEVVRHYRDRVTDPELKRQVAGFIGQESVHGREHHALNERLAELGYPTRRYEWLVRHAYFRFQDLKPPMARLAFAVAAEHITATLSEVFMSDEETRAMLGPVVSDILLWHALEETEHKAVAFDVYKLIGGTEKTRIRAAKEVRYSLAATAILFCISGLLQDRATYRKGNLRKAWREFKTWGLVQKAVWDRFKEQEVEGFHPNDRDHTELVAAWRERLFSDSGTLTPLLPDAAR